MALTPTLLFRVGTSLYGCDIHSAHEVIPLRAMTRLPGAPACVRGLINMRGTIVTVLDLGVRLDASRAPITDGSILLVRSSDHLVGLVIEELVDVRGVAIDETAASDVAGAITRGIAAVAESTALILDLDALVTQVLLFQGSKGGVS